MGRLILEHEGSSRTVNVLPRPRSLATAISAPIIRQVFWLRASPRPVP
jgi:hypothetical protein